jgi:heat shock protein HtpX
MRSPAVRVLLALVGLTMLAFYLTVGYLGTLLVVDILAGIERPDVLTTAAIVVVVALVFGYLSYQFGTSAALRRMDAAEVERARAPGLYDRLDRLTARMNVETPPVLVADLDFPNALAIGGGKEGVLVLDRRLFTLLDGPELEGVIAHELAHLENHDSLVQTLAASVIQTLVGLLVLVLLPLMLVVTGIERALSYLAGRPTGGVLSHAARVRFRVGQAVVVVLFGLTLLVRAHSRHREFAADDRAVEVTNRPLALARALRKIERASERRIGLFAPLYTHGVEHPMTRWLSTHPPMDERVARLVEQAEERGHRIPVR